MFVVLCVKFVLLSWLSQMTECSYIYCILCPKKEKKKSIFNRKMKRNPNLEKNGKTYNCPKTQFEINRLKNEIKKAKNKKRK